MYQRELRTKRSRTNGKPPAVGKHCTCKSNKLSNVRDVSTLIFGQK